MPRSEEAEHWFNAVYAAIQHIPPGKVTCYSHIAYLLDERELLPIVNLLVLGSVPIMDLTR
jgi:hypothetical protein